MKSIGMILSYAAFFGIGYLYLRLYWAGRDGLTRELFD